MTEETIGREIEALHEFFVEWFAGTCERSDALFESAMGPRLSDGFVLIQPSGKRFDRNGIMAAIASGYGNNPTFRIAIRNLVVCDQGAGWVLVTYEEWQRNALNSEPSDNGRVSTALFHQTPTAPGGLLWQHVHETWLPTEVMAAGPYDF